MTHVKQPLLSCSQALQPSLSEAVNSTRKGGRVKLGNLRLLYSSLACWGAWLGIQNQPQQWVMVLAFCSGTWTVQ